VCKLLEDYGTLRERRITYEYIESGMLSIENAQEKLHMTEAQILEDMEKEGYKVPAMA